MFGVTEMDLVIKPTSRPNVVRVGLTGKTWLAVAAYSFGPILVLTALTAYADRASKKIDKDVESFNEFDPENYQSPQEN